MNIISNAVVRKYKANTRLFQLPCFNYLCLQTTGTPTFNHSCLVISLPAFCDLQVWVLWLNHEADFVMIFDSFHVVATRNGTNYLFARFFL